MQTVAYAAATLAGILHIGFFVLESLLWDRPAVYRLFGVRTKEAAAATAFAIYNQGFYNLGLGVGTLVAAGLAVADEPSGVPIIIFTSWLMVLAAFVLVTSNRKLLRGALVQGLPPLVALIALFLS